MSLKIKYLKTKFKPSSNLVLFCDDKFKISKIKRYLSNNEFSYVNDLHRVSDLKKNLLVFELSSKKKIVLVSIKKNSRASEIESLGAEFFGHINKGKISEYFLISDSLESNNESFLIHFLHGLKLKSYSFKKYKTKNKQRTISINIIGKKNIPSAQTRLKFRALEEGTF